MGVQEAVVTCFRKYFRFSGRAGRPEFWWFVLFLFLGSLVTGAGDAILFNGLTVETVAEEGHYGFRAETTGPLTTLFSAIVIIPLFAVGWRRMHDTGRSGIYFLYPTIVSIGITMLAGLFGLFEPLASGDLAPLLGGVFGIVFGVALLVLLVSPLIVIWWLTRPSQPGTNQYGANPNEVTP